MSWVLTSPGATTLGFDRDAWSGLMNLGRIYSIWNSFPYQCWTQGVQWEHQEARNHFKTMYFCWASTPGGLGTSSGPPEKHPRNLLGAFFLGSWHHREPKTTIDTLPARSSLTVVISTQIDWTITSPGACRVGVLHVNTLARIQLEQPRCVMLMLLMFKC